MTLKERGVLAFKSWSQTLAIMTTIIIAVWGASLAMERRVTVLEEGKKNHEDRLVKAEATLQVAIQTQARLLELEEIWKKRHETEDNIRFQRAGVNPDVR